MPDMSIYYPEDLLITSGKSPKDLEAELLFLLAVKLYELRRLSLGKAAEFCHMHKIQFMFEHGCRLPDPPATQCAIGRMKIPVINLDDDQIADDLRHD
ncbi:MAG: UPF0175 family protein [Hormoscilla sp. GM102CHS1]|nr:UPF0175 family protein [Hormoscilla sp. GM102CHS1]